MDPIAPKLHIQLLGEFRISVQNEPLPPLAQARLQSLLAFLILNRNRPQTRQRLAFLFWPDSSEAQALSNLRKSLHTLRSAIPILDNYLRSDGKFLQWQAGSNFSLDVARFEESLIQSGESTEIAATNALLENAVECYTGDLLPDCYDEWIAPERERLREQFLHGLIRLSEGLETVRNFSAAIQRANQILRIDPLHESAYRRLMRLHLRNDDRAAALRIWHTCVATLKRELGVEPSPPTQEIYKQLLTLETPAPRPLTAHTRDAMVGRHGEWQQLQLVWRQTGESRARFVCIAGEAGIGKSRLAEEMAGWVRQQGFATATARAYEAEGSLAYDPIAEWLRNDALRRRMERLDDLWLQEIARLTPELLTTHKRLTAPQPLTESWQRRHFFEALARAFFADSQPMLLILDDLQWCDLETFEWLHYLLRLQAHSKIMIIGTLRPGEIAPKHPAQTLLRQLRQSQQVTEFELAPLSPDESSQLSQQVADVRLNSDQQASIYRMTEGNPFLIQEMVRAAMVESGSSIATFDAQISLPARMRAVIESRLAQLSAETEQLVMIAAACGRSFTIALLRQASKMHDEHLVAALDELWQRRIVREQSGERYDFSHDKVREVAYSAISPLRRKLIHRQIALALETVHSNELQLYSGQIAFHFRQAGEVALAARYYLRAAHEIQFGYAFDEVWAHLQQGVELLQAQPPSLENSELEIALRLAMGRIRSTRQGWGSPDAVNAFEAARQLCLLVDNLPHLVRAQDYLQVGYADSGRFEMAHALARSNLELTHRLGDAGEIEGAHGGLGLILWCLGRFDEARHHFEAAATLARQRAEQTGQTYQAFAYPGAFPHAHTLWLLGYPDQSRQLLSAVLEAQEGHNSPFDRLIGCEFCGMITYLARAWQQMVVYTRRELAISREYEYVAYQAIAENHLLYALEVTGEAMVGPATLRANIERLKAQGIRMWIPYELCQLADLCLRTGDLGKGLATLDEALTLAAETGELLWVAEVWRLRGMLLFASNAMADAEAAFRQSLRLAREQQARILELRAAISLAKLWHAQGQNGVARDLLTPIYGWFSEGFDSPDLVEAGELLSILGR